MTPGQRARALGAVVAIPVRPLLVVLMVSLVWRVPSLFDPPWVNDEGTYFAIAQAMSRGYRLYTGIWENKPPAIYLVYDAVYHLVGPSLLTIRIIAVVAALSLVVLVALISARYSDGLAPLVAGMLAGLLLGVPFLEGTTGNAEIFLSVGAALAVYLGIVKERPALAGLAGGVAVLFKAVGVLDVAAVAVWLSGNRSRSLPRYLAALLAVFLVAIFAAYSEGILPGMVRDAFLYDVGYVGQTNGGGIPWLLALKVIILVGATIWLRHRPFPFLWLVYAAVGALFSGRIFGHYFIQMVAPLSVATGLWIQRRPRLARGVLVSLPVAFLAAGLLSAAAGTWLASAGHDDILARRLQYYSNFARYALGSEPYEMYRAQVDDHVNRNIRIAKALRALPPGRLLIWGNIPWVYVLSDRLPATPYTSALRDPTVPGETATLQRAVRRGHILVVVLRPPAPVLGNAAAELDRNYRLTTRIDNAAIYVSRALAPRRVAKYTANARIGAR